MLAARAQAIKHLKQQHPFVEEGHLLSKLMAYCSKEAHSCVEKAAMICFVKLRILEPDSKCSLRGDTLTKAMEEDELQGLVPFFVSTHSERLVRVHLMLSKKSAVHCRDFQAYGCMLMQPMLGMHSFVPNSNHYLR